MLESCVKTTGVQTQQLKANANNKGNLLIPGPLGIWGHSFSHFWMCSRLWTDRVAKFFCQMCWKQKIVWQSSTKTYQPPSKIVLRGFQKWSEHQGNRQTHSWGTMALEEGRQFKWDSALWMFCGGEEGAFILNQSWVPWTFWVRKRNIMKENRIGVCSQFLRPGLAFIQTPTGASAIGIQ